MKCSKGCEGWNKNIDSGFAIWSVGESAMKFCPWCGSPLTEEPKMITRTVTYTEPVKEPLSDGQIYYYPYFCDEHVRSIKTPWSGNGFDLTMLKNGMVYLIEDHAIQRAKAMIGEV